MNRTISIALTLATLSVAGCGKEATGQVAAVVNGEEITLQEINAELGSTAIPDGVDKKAVQQAALQRIVERRLLAQAARDDELDKTPDYLLRERQLRDALLVQLMGQRAERSLKVPEQQEIDKFIADNPVMFGNRKQLMVDRIQFALPKNPDQLKALEDDHSMDAVAARLQQMGIEFRRDNTQVDSAALGQQRLQQIQALPAGEPFVIPENGVVTVGVITGERAEPVSPANARPIAVQAIRNKQLTDTIQQRLKQSRAAAEIEYQPGFAPAANSPASASKK
ncbi:peptidyl-prolyl cis-trans isomerase, EpsD family [Sphingopyxis sp. YR583]|uniref:SurA N-terminal domain-containing protein n=1 Tax=Sphingopyxis sp. YR583 TaxID=1881047 RepID=UPI0008A77D56|nr:SurA N-terminal domain-containing protein [Sphingopyxis sp. YR583]SEH18224.1 peptidyl-prolyl cis-trans isomerase, EpsD family [Sphingopyxis sp. YR583]